MTTDSEKQNTKKDKERVQFDFTHDAIQRFDAMQQESGAVTRAELMRNALKVYEWLLYDVDPDDIIQIVNKKGEITSAFKAKLLR